MQVGKRAAGLVKSAALWAGLAGAVCCIALAGLGFMVFGFDVWLARMLGAAAAAAITGGVLLLLAMLVAVIGGGILRGMRKRQPSMLAEFGGTVGIVARLVTLLVRRDPKKAIILSVIAGALAEYLVGEKK
jgi:hypothetical protein